MQDVKLSVIIPAFNAGETLRRCAESVLAQRCPLEAVIVDDGSADSTAAVADDLAARHPGRVRVIHRRNGGLSRARNSGIEAAAGGLLTFADSDDWIKEDVYPRLVGEMDSRPECDFLEFSLVRHDGRREIRGARLARASYAGGRRYWLESEGYSHAYAWNKIFRRRVFFPEDGSEGPRFTPDIVFEDADFMSKLLRRPLVAATVPDVGYVYTVNPGGITARAGAAEQERFLSTHLEIMGILGGGFAQGGRLSRREEKYYMKVLDIQITLCRLSPRPPRLFFRRVRLRAGDFLRPVSLAKKILLRLFGMETLCRIMRRAKH